ncbi:hypothetical protein EDD18DRAFT_1346642 [Armillaria luteobubalina]|uniref:RING-type domain-containing protein n=1 Tax=Armillaria luteobubalina TaxID=153913 RepID=A0AA39QHQ4_9AGAR|nr:hypothetical protein EDD18DRAFT_1346642 [Armillaria luteobubalina]
MHSHKTKPKSSKAKIRSVTGKGVDDPLFQGIWVSVAKPFSASSASSSQEEASILDLAEIPNLRALLKNCETESIRTSLDLQHHIGLWKDAQRDAEQSRQHLSEVEAQLALETAKLQLHMHECNSMKDLAMRQLALSLEQERRLASENTVLKDEIRMLKDHVSETDRRIATVLQIEEQVAAYEDDHNCMEFLRKGVLPLLDCGICLGTVKMPALLQCGHSFCAACLITWFEKKLTCPTCRAVLTKKPVVSITLSDIVPALMGTSPDSGLRAAAQAEINRLPCGLV